MATQFEKFIGTMKKVLMLDQADLDFGIYRIMNQKREQIESYLNNDLRNQVNEAIKENVSHDAETLNKELRQLVDALHIAGMNPDDAPKVKEIKERIAQCGSSEELENEVYSHLAIFFNRYYDAGDFISQRRYKKDVYAIPYEGEEVKLYWANADQYYIKTGEYFRNYRFAINDGKFCEFTLREATTEQNNNLAQNNMERRFALYEDMPLEVIGNTLHINFTYELYPKTIKQKALIESAFNTVKNAIPLDFVAVLALRPTESDRTRTLLQKHLNDYVARNTFDYFIHKDLGGFLSRELDFYIKNEILVIDDIDARTPDEFLKHLTVIKAIKTVGMKLITFLASLENYQKRLWLKKKFVVESNYCITLDRVPEKLYAEIAANDAQREEWVRLFAIHEVERDQQHTIAYSNPLTIEFLKENPYLVLDTKFFTAEFKNSLLASIDNIDEQCDGLLINSENFQALELLQEKYKETVDCVYIDPPYNSPSSEIAYKNSYKHSSWLALINDRVDLGRKLLSCVGSQVVAIDKYEHGRLYLQLMEKFEGYDLVSVAIEHNKKGTMGDHFSYNNEYAIFTVPYARKKLNVQVRDKRDWEWSKFRNWGSESERTDAKNCFFPIYVKDDQIIGYGDVCDDSYHPASNVEIQCLAKCYDFKGKLSEVNTDVIAIYPVDIQNVERKWRYAFQTMPEIINFLRVVRVENRRDIEIPKYSDQFKTLWYESKYNAGDYGTKILTSMGISKDQFQFPKSIFTTKDCIYAVSEKTSLVIDYFAGSGTTGHAVINLNSEDGGKRKYILCEMGEYFDSVTKPRIQKVIYSKDWNNGKPVSREGSSHCFKYMRLEQYEDTLNNLAVESVNINQENADFYGGYMLGYMLDVETRDSLFNMKWFKNPWNMNLRITRQNETREENIDVIETFNYLIGLNVRSILHPKKDICTVEGVTRRGERTLVIWRNCDTIDNKTLNDFFSSMAYSTRDTEFDRIYVNGDNNLENLRTDEEQWKVVLTEQEFAKRMFEDC